MNALICNLTGTALHDAVQVMYYLDNNIEVSITLPQPSVPVCHS